MGVCMFVSVCVSPAVYMFGTGGEGGNACAGTVSVPTHKILFQKSKPVSVCYRSTYLTRQPTRSQERVLGVEYVTVAVIRHRGSQAVKRDNAPCNRSVLQNETVAHSASDNISSAGLVFQNRAPLNFGYTSVPYSYSVC